MPGQLVMDACPSYLGSKAKQAPNIFKAIQEAGFGEAHLRDLTFVDPFAGGCSLAVMAKALGYRVLANDIAARSFTVGKALVENRDTRLAEDEIAAALTTDPAGWYTPPLKQLPWPNDSRDLLRSIAKFAASREAPMRQHMLRAWLVKFAARISIYGQPRMTVHQRIRDRNWDAMTPAMVDRILMAQTKPRPIAQQTARELNSGVFSNGKRNEMHRMDALEFLRGVTGDVVYIDPPYPDTEGYGRNYAGIDGILEDREVDADEGRFATPDGWMNLREVVEACEAAPLVVISLGAEVKHVDADDLAALLQSSGREVQVQSIEYGLLQSRATEKSSRKREHMLLGLSR
jgi:hypothetical protein